MDEKRKRMGPGPVGGLVGCMAFPTTIIIGGLIGSQTEFDWIDGSKFDGAMGFVIGASISLTLAALPVSVVAGVIAALLRDIFSPEDSE